MNRYFERRYHASWMFKHGRSPLAQLGAWMVQHRARVDAAPQALLRAALLDVEGRLPVVAVREPTRRHRKHFGWLLGWQARLLVTLRALPCVRNRALEVGRTRPSQGW